MLKSVLISLIILAVIVPQALRFMPVQVYFCGALNYITEDGHQACAVS